MFILITKYVKIHIHCWMHCFLHKRKRCPNAEQNKWTNLRIQTGCRSVSGEGWATGILTVMAKLDVKCLCHKNKAKPVNIPNKKQVTHLYSWMGGCWVSPGAVLTCLLQGLLCKTDQILHGFSLLVGCRFLNLCVCVIAYPKWSLVVCVCSVAGKLSYLGEEMTTLQRVVEFFGSLGLLARVCV